MTKAPSTRTLLTLAFAGIISLSGKSSAATNSHDARGGKSSAVMKELRDALVTSDYKLALKICNRLLQSDPHNVAVHALRAVAEQDLKKDAAAESDLRFANNASIKSALDWDAIGEARIHIPPFDSVGALKAYNTSIQKDPNSAQTYLDRGKLYAAYGKPKEAESDFNKALELDPKFANAHFQRAHSRQSRGELYGAIADITKAIQLQPISFFYEYRADLYKTNNQMANALDDYNKALSLERKSNHYAGRGSWYMSSGQYAKALPDLDRAIALNPTGLWQREMRVTALISLFRAPEALSEMNQIDKLVGPGERIFHRQDLADLWELRYKAYRANNKWSSAVIAMENFSELAPTNRWAKAELAHAKEMAALQEPLVTGNAGSLSKKQGKPIAGKPATSNEVESARFYYLQGKRAEETLNYNGAVENCTRSILIDPTYFEAYRLRAEAYSQQDKYDKAIADLEYAAKLKPKDTDALSALETIHRVQTKYPEAIDDCTRMIQRCAYSRYGLTRRTTLFLLVGKPQEALADAEKAVQYYPTDQYSYKVRAAAYMKLGNYDKAIADFTSAINLFKVENDQSSALHLKRAEAYEKLGKKDLAAQDRKKAQEFADTIYEGAPFAANSKSNR